MLEENYIMDMIYTTDPVDPIETIDTADSEEYIFNTADQKKFENDYKEFLDALDECPRAERMKLYREMVDTKLFAERLLEATQNSNYNRLKKNLQKLRNDKGGVQLLTALEDVNSSNYMSMKRKYLDGVDFMETIEYTILGYHRFNKDGEEKSFCRNFNKNFSHRKNRTLLIQIFNNMTQGCGEDVDGYPDEVKAAIIRAKFDIDRKLASISNISAEEKNRKIIELIEEKIDENGKLRKKDEKILFDLLTDRLSFLSLDAPAGKDSDDESNYDKIAGMTDKAFELGETGLLSEEEAAYVENIIVYWKQQIELCEGENESTKDLLGAELYRLFLTRCLLQVLKLREITSDMKEYLEHNMGKTESEKFFNEKQEPKCPGFIRCNYLITDKNEPAGNRDWYDAMQPFENVIYGYLFHAKFIAKAFDDATEDLYDVYSLPLTEQPVFQDNFAAEAAGISSSGLYKQKKKFLKEFNAYRKKHWKALRE